MVYFSLGLTDLLPGRNAPTAEYWLRAFCGTKFLEQGACEDTGYPP